MTASDLQSPSRILVTGNAGSGKSTLARQIGEALRLPIYGVDAIVWRPGWKRPPAPERDRLLTELASRSRWVIDGVSRLIESRAELVIFLDVSPLRCTWRCAKRNWRYLFRSRPGLPDHCPEWHILPTLLHIIWRFNRDVRPAILARAAAGSGPVYWHVRNGAGRAAMISHLLADKAERVHDIAS